MKADALKLLKFMQKECQMTIPIYQRKYTWEEPQCEQLWQDIVTAGKNTHIKGHFIGSIVYIKEESELLSGTLECCQIVDGQQRLTTMTLLLEALARKLDKSPTSNLSNTITGKKLRSYYLLNNLEEGDLRQRLNLTGDDQQTLIAILRNTPYPKETSPQIISTFKYFQKKLDEYEDELDYIYTGIHKIKIVEIGLKSDEDDPQLIFESLNSTGRKLVETDLIRNFILMGLNSQNQKLLYSAYWQSMEKMFSTSITSNSKKINRFDRFFRDYLTIRNDGQTPRISRIYEEFKRYILCVVIDKSDYHQIKNVVDDIYRFAGFYGAILGLNCQQAILNRTPKLRDALADLRKLNVEP